MSEVFNHILIVDAIIIVSINKESAFDIPIIKVVGYLVLIPIRSIIVGKCEGSRFRAGRKNYMLSSFGVVSRLDR
jgi:hypothetical protein